MNHPDYQSEASAEFISNITRNQRRLYAFIYSLVLNSVDAEDLLQEVNLVLWQKSDEFTHGSDFMAWAFRIAQFQVMAFRKRKTRSREHLDERFLTMLADEAQKTFSMDSRHEALMACLKKLNQRQRSLIAQRYEPGGSVNEMANRENRSPKAISETLRRIREILMKCIQSKTAMEGS